jgi:hypothetical protein
MKEEPKEACVNFRITKTYKQWLEEILVEEGFFSFSEYFNKQILMKKIESIIKKLISEAKKRVMVELNLPSNFSKNARSPIDIEGIFPELDEKVKDKWLGEFKFLFTKEFGLEDELKDKFEDLSNFWLQVANFSSDFNVMKELTFLISQKSEKFKNLTRPEGGE